MALVTGSFLGEGKEASAVTNVKKIKLIRCLGFTVGSLLKSEALSPCNKAIWEQHAGNGARQKRREKKRQAAHKQHETLMHI